MPDSQTSVRRAAALQGRAARERGDPRRAARAPHRCRRRKAGGDADLRGARRSARSWPRSCRGGPQSDPPVCKILDYGKFRFEEQKKKAETRKKAKRIELKEIKVRPNIDDHDYEVKMKAIHRFFEEGDKVKVTLRFRGREMQHTNLGMELAGAHAQRTRPHRQGRARAALRRPPSRHGDGAARVTRASAAVQLGACQLARNGGGVIQCELLLFAVLMLGACASPGAGGGRGAGAIAEHIRMDLAAA